MPKPSRTKVVNALTDYARLSAEVAAAERAFAAETLAAKQRYDRACAAPLAVLEAARAERAPEIKRLAEAIEAELLQGVGDDGSVALPQVTVPGATATVAQQVTRTIAPEDWLGATPEHAREAAWYECLSVLITKVDKKFGEKFKALVTTRCKPRVDIVLTPVAEEGEQ